MASAAGDLAFHSQLIGRAAELAKLDAQLESAAGGRGRVVFLAGEAGIGKSRLLAELAALAAARGFRTMAGTCFHEALTPYSAFLEAFQEGGLEYLFVEEPLRVESLFVIDSAGLVLAKAERTESPLDPDIFTSMIRVVEEFLKDAVKQAGGSGKGALNVLGLGDYRILLEAGPHATIVAILTGRENEFLVDELRGVLAEVEERFGTVLATWAGTLEDLEGMDDILKPVLASKKYDGVDYARGDAQIKRNRLFENVSLGLVRDSRREPILLTLDDLQWADPSSIALIHYLGRGIRNARVLVIGAYRGEELAMGLRAGAKHPLEEAIQLMSREGLHEEMRLARLDEAQTTELVESLLGKVDLVEEYEREVFRHSGGNPFFLIELARLVISEGLLVWEGDVWRFSKTFRQVEIPTGVYHVVLRRLQRVTGEMRDVLDVAAILGEEFAADVLAASLGRERIALLRLLRDLEATHQLVRSSQAKYRFDHPQVREVLLREMPDGIRMEYHRIAAETLEQIHGPNLSKNYRALGEVAVHCFEARDADRGVPYNIQAGAAARQAYANAEAIQFYSQALELMGTEAAPPTRAEVLETRGDLNKLAGRYDEAITDYRLVLSLLAGHAEAAGRLHRKIGSVFQHRGKYAEAESELKAGLTALGEQVSAEAGTLELWLGKTAERRGAYDVAMEHYTRGSEILEAAPDRDELDLAEALFAAGMIHYLRALKEPSRTREEVDAARGQFVACLEARRRRGDELGMRNVLNNLANTFAYEGDYGQAAKFYTESLRIGEKIGDLWGITKPLINLGRIHRLQGNGDEALATFLRALGILLKIGDQRGVASVYREAAEVYLGRGEFDNAIDYNRRGLEIAERIGDKLERAGSLMGLGEAFLEAGHPREAVPWLEMAMEAFEALGAWDLVCSAGSDLVRAHLADRKLEEARATGTRARESAAKAKTQRLEGLCQTMAAAIARTAGDLPEAERSIEAADLAFHGHAGDADVAVFEYEKGLLMIALGRREEGTASLGRAEDAARKIGRPGLADLAAKARA
ncbi:MAG TPA: tetratricopeptide repeat protein [Thermoplasmata archaeon]|nr:tetratricopeptide repeat protein [Thermoplasmata archaeon]